MLRVFSEKYFWLGLRFKWATLLLRITSSGVPGTHLQTLEVWKVDSNFGPFSSFKLLGNFSKILIQIRWDWWSCLGAGIVKKY